MWRRSFMFFNQLFCRSVATAAMDKPKTLSELGYGFNEKGLLRKLDSAGKITDQGFEFKISTDDRVNQANYEAIGESITPLVYELLEKNGLTRLIVPKGQDPESSSFIYTSTTKLKGKKLLILIHGSGVVRAGQWARSLIINESLDHGTQIPYIKKAVELGYEVMVLNTNDNYRGRNIIRGSGNPSEHAITVFKDYIMQNSPESIAIVGHSYGGQVITELVAEFPEYFEDRVFGIAFTDSVHRGASGKAGVILNKLGLNYVTSPLPVGEPIQGNHNVARASAGHIKHEWTSWACKDVLFTFLEEKYKEFTKSKSSKAEL